MPSSASFSIEASPGADRGYDAAAADPLNLQLEASPALDVLSCTYTVERASPGAPAWADPGPAVPVTAIVATAVPTPVPDGASWMLRCTIVLSDGTEVVFERIVAVRHPNTTRLLVPGETIQYDPVDGWVSSVNEAMSLIP